MSGLSHVSGRFPSYLPAKSALGMVSASEESLKAVLLGVLSTFPLIGINLCRYFSVCKKLYIPIDHLPQVLNEI